MKKLLIAVGIIILLAISCAKPPTYTIEHCIPKPTPPLFKNEVACGGYLTKDIKQKYVIEPECFIGLEDFYHLLIYFEKLDKYSSDECIKININN